jgi:hypothetical protein
MDIMTANRTGEKHRVLKKKIRHRVASRAAKGAREGGAQRENIRNEHRVFAYFYHSMDVGTEWAVYRMNMAPKQASCFVDVYLALSLFSFTLRCVFVRACVRAWGGDLNRRLTPRRCCYSLIRVKCGTFRGRFLKTAY